MTGARTPSTVARRIALVARAGAVEATTYLVLVAAIVWHALLDGPDASRSLGLTHGLVFLAYAATVLRARPVAGWDSRTTISLLVASVVPGAGFIVPRRVIGPARRPRPPALTGHIAADGSSAAGARPTGPT